MDAATLSVAETIDGISNVIARMERVLGTDTLGKASTSGFLTGNQHYLDLLYRQNWLAQRVVDCVADDMARDGIEISVPGYAQAINSFLEAEKETALWDRITDGIRWGRLYGGAIVVLLLAGQNPETPLDPMTVGRGQFKGFHVLDRWQVSPSSERIAELGRDFGLPEFYTINASGMRIHHSRVIRFVGTPIPPSQQERERFWTASTLEKVADEVIHVKESSTGIAKLLKMAYLRIVGIEGYRDMVAKGGDAEDRVIRHYTTIARLQSIMGLTLLDSKDQFHTNSYGFAGVRDAQLCLVEQVSGATGIPLIRLIGQSEGGLNANGETSERTYYDEVMRDTERELRHGMDRIIPVVFRSKEGGIPEDWSFSFKPLYQMKATEIANVVEQEARTAVMLEEAGLFDKERAIREIMAIGKRHERFADLDEDALQEIMANAPTLGGDYPELEMERPLGEEEAGESTGLLSE